MKKIISSVFIFSISLSVSAQLIIIPGAQLYMQNNSEITLENIDLINDGDFIAGAGTVFFTGSPMTKISGGSPVTFYNLSLNKASNSILRLQRSIGVTNNVLFNTGVIDLNTFDIDLGATGSLIGESETSRIVGTTGGQIVANRRLNAPISINPANLGATITSANNLGNVIVRRGHQQQTNVSGSFPGIYRYYEIVPENFNELKVNLRLNYFDVELSDIGESGLVIWRKDGESWTNLGFSARNPTENFVEQEGIGSLSRFTLANEPANPLTRQEPVESKLTREQNGIDAINVWPNPVTDLVNVSIHSLTNTDVTLILFDIKGALIHSEFGKLNAGLNQLQVNLSRLPAGVYTLHSNWGKNRKVVQLIKR